MISVHGCNYSNHGRHTSSHTGTSKKEMACIWWLGSLMGIADNGNIGRQVGLASFLLE